VAVEKELQAWDTFVAFYYIGAHLTPCETAAAMNRSWMALAEEELRAWNSLVASY